MNGKMLFKLPLILSVVAAPLEDRADLVAENTALRQQISYLVHRSAAAFQDIQESKRCTCNITHPALAMHTPHPSERFLAIRSI